MPSAKQQQRNSSHQLNTQWVAGVLDKEGLIAHLQNSGNMLVLVRLKEILKDKLDAIEKDRLSCQNFEMSSWPYFQAHTNGQIATLKWIVEDLLPFVTDRTTK